MKFLVTGALGQLGSEVVRCFRGLGHTVVAPGKRELNLLRPDQIRQAVTDARPDWVINCAAYTQVDKAESDAATAFRINRDGEIGHFYWRAGYDYRPDEKSLQ